VVVTRYFGGVLLGAGGLVRAYSGSTATAVEASGMIEFRPATRMELRTDYGRYASLRSYVAEHGQLLDTIFLEDVRLVFMTEDPETFIKDVVELSDGRCRPEKTGEDYIQVPLFT